MGFLGIGGMFIEGLGGSVDRAEASRLTNPLRCRAVVSMAARILPLMCLLTSALATACSSPDPEPPPAPVQRVQSVQGQWTLVELNGQPVTFEGGRVPSLDLANDGLVAGLAGVNRFTGHTDAQGLREGRFDLGPLAVTKMAGSAELMAFERRYLTVLESADRALVKDGKLELWQGKTCLARFERQG